MFTKCFAAIILLLHIGLCFAQNSNNGNKPPASPFSFTSGKATLNNSEQFKPADLPIIVEQKAFVNGTINQPSFIGSTTNNITQTQQQKDFEANSFLGETKKYFDNLSERILDPFIEKLNYYGLILKKAAFRLFMYLSGFMILFRFIKYLMQGEHDFVAWLVDTAFMAVFIQIIAHLIKNSDNINLDIISWFRAIAGEATGTRDIKPSLLIDLGLDYFNAQVKMILSFSITDLLKGLLLMSISGLTVMTIGLLGLFYVKALIESIILAQFSVLFLAFLGLEQTRDIGMRPFFLWINLGIKLMFLQMMIGLEVSLLQDFINMDDISVASSASVLFVSVFMLALTYEVPKIFEKLLTGSVTIGGLSQNAIQGIARGVASMKTGGVAGATFSGAVGAAQQIGGAQKALQSYEAYRNSQGGGGFAAQKPIEPLTPKSAPFSADGGSGGSIRDRFLNSALGGGSNSKKQNTNQPQGSIQDGFARFNEPKTDFKTSFDTNASTQSENASSGKQSNSATSSLSTNNTSMNSSSNNTSNSSLNNNASNASTANSLSSAVSGSSTVNQNSGSQQPMGFFEKAAGATFEMAKDKYNDGVNKSAGGRMAQHFDQKTAANNEAVKKQSIDDHFQNLWRKPEKQPQDQNKQNQAQDSDVSQASIKPNVDNMDKSQMNDYFKNLRSAKKDPPQDNQQNSKEN